MKAKNLSVTEKINNTQVTNWKQDLKNLLESAIIVDTKGAIPNGMFLNVYNNLVDDTEILQIVKKHFDANEIVYKSNFNVLFELVKQYRKNHGVTELDTILEKTENLSITFFENCGSIEQRKTTATASGFITAINSVSLITKKSKGVTENISDLRKRLIDFGVSEIVVNILTNNQIKQMCQQNGLYKV